MMETQNPSHYSMDDPDQFLKALWRDWVPDTGQTELSSGHTTESSNNNSPVHPPTRQASLTSLSSTSGLLISTKEDIKEKIEITVMHKPRGSKGNWQPVAHYDKLRVTKGKGKKMKLEMRTYDQPKDAKVFVQLLDLEPNPAVICPDSCFAMESVRIFEGLVEVDIKLFQVGKRLQFSAHYRTATGEVFYGGKSVEFSTHTSGTAHTLASMVSEKHKDAEQKRTLSSPESSQSTEPPSSKRKVEENITTTNGPPPIPPRNPSSPFLAPPLQTQQAQQQDSFQIYNSQEGSSYMSSGRGSGLLQIPGNLEVDGTVKAKAFIQFSDLRLKTNIADITNALQIVSSLKGKTYEWKKDQQFTTEKGGKRVIGLIAQEVQRVLPEIVYEDPKTGILSVSYVELVPVLIEALKEFIVDVQSTRADTKLQLDHFGKQLDHLSQAMVRMQQDNNNSGILEDDDEEEEAGLLPPVPKEYKSEGIPLTPSSRLHPVDMKDPKKKKKGWTTAQKVFSITFSISIMFILAGLALFVIGAVNPFPKKRFFSMRDDDESESDHQSSRQILMWSFGAVSEGVGMLGAALSCCGFYVTRNKERPDWYKC